jgi:hypothetical protein
MSTEHLIFIQGFVHKRSEVAHVGWLSPDDARNIPNLHGDYSHSWQRAIVEVPSVAENRWVDRCLTFFGSRARALRAHERRGSEIVRDRGDQAWEEAHEGQRVDERGAENVHA